MAASFARCQQEVELDRSPILRGQKKKPRPTREATGDGEEGGCRLARVHEAGKPQWISGACECVPGNGFLSIGPWSNVAIWRSNNDLQMHVCASVLKRFRLFRLAII